MPRAPFLRPIPNCVALISFLRTWACFVTDFLFCFCCDCNCFESCSLGCVAFGVGGFELVGRVVGAVFWMVISSMRQTFDVVSAAKVISNMWRVERMYRLLHPVVLHQTRLFLEEGFDIAMLEGLWVEARGVEVAVPVSRILLEVAIARMPGEGERCSRI